MACPSQEHAIRLIQLYGEYKVLWDPKHPKHLSKSQRVDCWQKISAEMQCSVVEIKKKMDSLLGSYRREKSREKKSYITGSGAEDVYKSKWFGYPYFDFMKNKNEPGDTLDTIPIEVQPLSPISDVVVDTDNESSNLVEQSQDNDSSNQAQQSRSNIDEGGSNQAQQSRSNIDEGGSNKPLQEPPLKKKRPNKNPKSKSQPQVDPVDTMFEEAFQILQKSSNDVNDPYLSYGKHIANELRKYDPHTMKHAINNIMFEADLGKYSQQQYNPGYYTQQYSSTSSSGPVMTPSPAAVLSPGATDA